MDGKRKLRKIRLVPLTKSLWKILLHKFIVMKYRGVRTTFGDTFVTLSTPIFLTISLRFSTLFTLSKISERNSCKFYRNIIS